MCNLVKSAVGDVFNYYDQTNQVASFCNTFEIRTKTPLKNEGMFGFYTFIQGDDEDDNSYFGGANGLEVQCEKFRSKNTRLYNQVFKYSSESCGVESYGSGGYY